MKSMTAAMNRGAHALSFSIAQDFQVLHSLQWL